MELESRNYKTLARDRRFVTWIVDRAYFGHPRSRGSSAQSFDCCRTVGESTPESWTVGGNRNDRVD